MYYLLCVALFSLLPAKTIRKHVIFIAGSGEFFFNPHLPTLFLGGLLRQRTQHIFFYALLCAIRKTQKTWSQTCNQVY